MTVNRYNRVAIFGASSQIAPALLAQLARKKIAAYPITRGNTRHDLGTVYVFDKQRFCFNPRLTSIDAVISLAPLPSIDVVINICIKLGATRLIAFGSMGRFSKTDSTSVDEQKFVSAQKKAEHILASECESAGIAWTLFRPTMIYGAGLDLNVTYIRSMIQRFGFFPIPWGAKGLRQPVHVEDLAAACVSALESDSTFQQIYNLGGGEVLSLPKLVENIFHSEGKTPIVVPIPVSIYYVVLEIIKKFTKSSFLRKEMIDRMFLDMPVDNRPARDDFGYNPRLFSIGLGTCFDG